MSKKTEGLIPEELIEKRIYLIRGQKVMLDRDLAELYGVQTKVLNQAVQRNLGRFPEDFMFQMNQKELENWKSQIVTSNREKMGLRKRPFLFTEQGVAMLSGILHSRRAVQMNVAIMRTFVKLRHILSTHKDLTHQLGELERKVGKHDNEIQAIFDAIRNLMAPPEEKPKRRIGFHSVES